MPRSYAVQFRVMVIEQVRAGGKVADVARSVGVSEASLTFSRLVPTGYVRWMKRILHSRCGAMFIVVILTGFLVSGATVAAANSQSSQLRKIILDAITKNDLGVCTQLFTDHGVVDDVNALYVRGFNGPQISDPGQAAARCEDVHTRNATPARSLVIVKTLKVKGKAAHASVEVGVGGTYDIGLVQRGGHWKIDAVN